MLLFIAAFSLFGCTTCSNNAVNFELPTGYSLVETGGKFKVITPDGILTEPEWLTREGAIGYAMSHNSLNMGN